MLADGLPGQFLEQAVEFVQLLAVSTSPKIIRYGKPDRAATVDDRVITVRDEDSQRRMRVTDGIPEQVFLLGQAGSFAVDDLLTEKNDRLSRGNDKQ